MFIVKIFFLVSNSLRMRMSQFKLVFRLSPFACPFVRNLMVMVVVFVFHPWKRIIFRHILSILVSFFPFHLPHRLRHPQRYHHYHLMMALALILRTLNSFHPAKYTKWKVGELSNKKVY